MSANDSALREYARTEVAVVAVAALALLARLVDLGSRVAHQDEGRVAYWAYQYMETGVFFYRPIVHGPFLQHVNAVLFEAFGATDFTMRLVVAVVGGLLPLGALLFRDRLRDSAVVALALLLAANPILLYFSRFYRNDLLLAGFMLLAFGFFVRAIDTQKARHVYAGVALFALAFTTKENALVYALTWAGATVLLLDHRLYLAHVADDDWTTVLSEHARQTARSLLRWTPHLLVAVVEFFAIIVFFYAPRRPESSEVGLGEALSNPMLFPGVVEEATVGSWNAFLGTWGGGMQDHGYLPYLEEFLLVLQAGALALVALAVLGFVVDRYTGDRPNDVVSFTFYWGFVSVLGYPIIVGNPFPWEMVHMVVPLAVPAAVGLSLVYREGRDAAASDDGTTAAIAGVLLVLVAAQVGYTAVQTSYVHPADSERNELVQYAQPGGDMKPTLESVYDIAASHSGTDVLFYGDRFYSPDESDHRTPPAGAGWFDRLPLPWYFQSHGVNVSSTERPSDLQSNPPPVVVALGHQEGASMDENDITGHLDGYKRYQYQLYQWDEPIVFFVDEDATNGG